jgi:D-alanyl-D-alanine carboxypeptidase
VGHQSLPSAEAVARRAARSAALAALLLPALSATSLSLLAAPDVPPSALQCLARYYAIVPEREERGWVARLPDGQALPFDDGRNRTFEERLAAPDLEDMFALPYRPGPIRPVTTIDDDPGRVRLEALFAAAYGAPPKPSDLVFASLAGATVRVHRRIAPAVERVGRRLRLALENDPSLAAFLKQPAGGFVWRDIAGTTRRSAHGYGIAIDIDAKAGQYWRWQTGGGPPRWENRVPQAIVDAFEAEGFIWGGRWYHYDTMHFEYRPELLDPTCRNAETVEGPPSG